MGTIRCKTVVCLLRRRTILGSFTAQTPLGDTLVLLFFCTVNMDLEISWLSAPSIEISADGLLRGSASLGDPTKQQIIYYAFLTHFGRTVKPSTRPLDQAIGSGPGIRRGWKFCRSNSKRRKKNYAPRVRVQSPFPREDFIIHWRHAKLYFLTEKEILYPWPISFFRNLFVFLFSVGDQGHPSLGTFQTACTK